MTEVLGGPTNPRQPYIERTQFDPVEPPRRITRWFCPACGSEITGSYSLDPAKKRCTKTWHLTDPVKAYYKRVVEGEDA